MNIIQKLKHLTQKHQEKCSQSNISERKSTSDQSSWDVANGELPEGISGLNAFNTELQEDVRIMMDMFGDPEQSS